MCVSACVCVCVCEGGGGGGGEGNATGEKPGLFIPENLALFNHRVGFLSVS